MPVVPEGLTIFPFCELSAQILRSVSMMAKNYILTGADPDEVIPFLEDRIYEHNVLQLNHNDGRLFSKTISSDDGRIIAGVAGWTWAGACEITQLWVDTSVRNKGWGKILLDAAEEEAKKRECTTILIRTYSFQAPSFYASHGYYTEHVIESFPSGHRYHLMIKTIN